MPSQRELPLSFPELSPEAPFIPVRMVNEYVYCPRLAYLEWVQGEFAHNADTIEGAIRHRRVDKGEGALPEEPKDGERLVIEVEKEKVAEARLMEISQVALFGHTIISAATLHECIRRGIPVTWHTYGGWFVGHTVGTGHHNVETRTPEAAMPRPYQGLVTHAAILAE